ncbi:von Willebrand factor A domain-containing protein 8, partial [Rhizoclosmatium hyalinum]
EVDATKAPASIVDPKEGKIDPKNEPHVGGNTWKGGTGGSSTAGLGGRGGPYRLDAGHKVHQLSDEEKAKVPKHVLEAARKMGQDALKKRLEEIKMNSYEAELYSQIFDAVKGDIQRLKVILEGAKAKEKERVWNKNQVIGELDDTKLVEGIIGETAIYKTRGNEVQDFGLVQKKPKRVKIVFDVSGSMYRFNGLDGRLNRSLETALLIMASMDNSLRSKFVYDVVGHSGDSPCIPLVDKGKPPQNEMDQMKVLQNMNANAQFCWSGDNTVNALQRAITDLAKEADEADECHVILLSDANLRRYGITASELGRVMESNERVNAAVVFIGSLGNEAAKLVSELPRGKAFLAMDTSKIPSIMKELFSAIVN